MRRAWLILLCLVAASCTRAMHLDPEQILSLLVDDLTVFTKSNKGTISVAADPWNFLELLAEAPQGWRCVVHWAGDENLQPDIPAAFLKNEFHVGVTANLGLTIKPGEAVMKKRPGGTPSLLKLVALTRDRVRSFVFPPEVTSMHPQLLGTDPVTLPDGTPLAGYRLRFSLTTHDEPVVYRQT
jgi:hypothetical protein